MQAMEEKIRRIIQTNIKTKIPVEKIGPDEPLENFGLNSMNFIKIVVELENEFGVVFDDQTLRFNGINTINKLATHITSLNPHVRG